MEARIDSSASQARGAEAILIEAANRTLPAAWRPFLREHGSTLAKNHGWELRFLSEVLARVPSLRPDHVSPQHPFRDMSGGRRYIDFAILIGDRRLAVEVDGFDKAGLGGPTPERHVDFTERQNALSLQGWSVLRFTNRQFSRDPETCVRHLELTVKDMFDRSAKSRAALRAYLTRLETEVQSKAAASQGADRQMYEEQQTELRSQLGSISERLEALNRRSNTVGKVLLAAAILVATSAYLLVEKSRGIRETAAPASPSVIELGSPVVKLQAGMLQPAGGATSSPQAAPITAPIEAAAHVGQVRKVCGRIAQVVPAVGNRPWYLNFDKSFPQQTFQSIVWAGDAPRIQDALGRSLSALRGSDVCIAGQITSYKGTAQLRLRFGDQVTFRR